ncbi:hypothetical protein TWF696_009777 [Orbilia brochopaga]|uniref:Uncharacterized protein n=1 Tax=Orbilia brochopaga TaxID=3140254 RepID=A0AAV9UGK5_9PEZI
MFSHTLVLPEFCCARVVGKSGSQRYRTARIVRRKRRRMSSATGGSRMRKDLEELVCLQGGGRALIGDLCFL